MSEKRSLFRDVILCAVKPGSDQAVFHWVPRAGDNWSWAITACGDKASRGSKARGEPNKITCNECKTEFAARYLQLAGEQP